MVNNKQFTEYSKISCLSGNKGLSLLWNIYFSIWFVSKKTMITYFGPEKKGENLLIWNVFNDLAEPN